MVAKNRFCKSIPESRMHDEAVVKFYRNGHWFEIWLNKVNKIVCGPRRIKMMTSLRTTGEIHDCNKCKHRLACLIQVNCIKTYESR